MEVGVDDLHELMLRDRTAAKLEIDLDMVGDRSRCLQRVNERGVRIDDRDEFVDVCEVLECLNTSCCCTRPDAHECRGFTADLLDPFGIVGCRHGAFDEGEVVGSCDLASRGLREVGDVDGADDVEQFVLAIEQRELATVTRCELPDGELRLLAYVLGHSDPIPSLRATAEYGNTGPFLQMKSAPN